MTSFALPSTDQKPQAAIIMAAGKGTRMRSKRNKILHEVAGLPMISRVVANTLNAGIKRIVVIVGHQSEEVIELLQRDFPNTDLHWAVQAEQKGTAHAVRCAEDALSDFDGDVWILSGDVPTLSAELLRQISAAYPKQGLIVTGMRLAEPKSYGRLLKDQEGQLIAIREARDCSAEQLMVNEVNAGLYRVDAQLLFNGLKTIQSDNAQGEYYLTDLVEYAHLQNVQIACPVLEHEQAQELEGVNDRLDLAKAESRAQQKLAEKLLREGVTLLRPKTIRLSERLSIAEDVTIEEDRNS